MLYKIKRQGIEPKTIIDVGASIGIFTKAANYLYPEAKIYSFEPLDSSFFKMKSLIGNNKNIKMYNFALGEKNGHILINKNKYEYSSSIFDMSDIHKNAFPYTAESAKQEIDVKILDEVFYNESLERPILIKLDVQGYELNVLEGATNFLKKCDYIIIELSFKELYIGQPLFNDIYSFLINNNFILIDFIDYLRNPVSFELLQVDAVFKNQFLEKKIDEIK
jgi:FkbM family methyltransferase